MPKKEYAHFVVCEAEMKDVPAIAKITHEAFLKYRNLAGIEDVEALNEDEQTVIEDMKNKIVLVAFMDDEIVGSVRLEINQEDHTAYFSRFGVNTVHQNMGIGKSMMNVVDKVMKEYGVKKLYLHTATKITSLVRFYYGRGFYIDSTDKSKGYIRGLFIKEY